MLTTFWDLCSDVILEICGYFSINELYFSFYPNVLPHLFNLLTVSHIQLHFCLTNDDLLTGTLLSLIDSNQILSLHIKSCNIPLNLFNKVKTLTFHDVKNVHSAISQPSILPSLEHLILVYSRHFSQLTENVLNPIFARSSLKYLKIEASNEYIALPNNRLRKSFSIELLIINASCSHATLNFFLTSLPNLRVLQIKTLMYTPSTTVRNPLVNMNVIAPLTIPHSSLQSLNLVWYHPTMVDIRAILRGLTNLKQFRLKGVMKFSELDGKSWHRLITQTCPSLLKMNVNMLIWTEDQTEEIIKNFDQDIFFELINFYLIPNVKDKQLFILFGDFQRFLLE